MLRSKTGGNKQVTFDEYVKKEFAGAGKKDSGMGQMAAFQSAVGFVIVLLG